MCNYVVAIDDKTLVVTNSAMKKINMVNQDGEVILLKDTKPLYPTFIGRSLDGGILVSMIDKPDFQRQDFSKRVVQHINLTGSIKKTYAYEEDNTTPLFTYPESVTQNTNTDICVINFSSESTGHLCVLHASGKVRFTYKGQSDSESLFFPSDVCCDSHCNIMVSDGVNRSIHLLNSAGQFIKYIMSKTNIVPICMSIINDHLWIGCEKGEIKLLSIKH
ncbi:hypothetical protein FSP39_018191 [Pinctada imbricata]|uniref:Tripartite motif-containing protein 2 n=1 Tax=Pinctada imbricata TaxID=66713 RepID=A0AA88XXA1_PINIB|nr:hypothetical protein FSP39_018191 [Pinctada imbricata]